MKYNRIYQSKLARWFRYDIVKGVKKQNIFQMRYIGIK